MKKLGEFLNIKGSDQPCLKKDLQKHFSDPIKFIEKEGSYVFKSGVKLKLMHATLTLPITQYYGQEQLF